MAANDDHPAALPIEDGDGGQEQAPGSHRRKDKERKKERKHKHKHKHRHKERLSAGAGDRPAADEEAEEGELPLPASPAAPGVPSPEGAAPPVREGRWTGPSRSPERAGRRERSPARHHNGHRSRSQSGDQRGMRERDSERGRERPGRGTYGVDNRGRSEGERGMYEQRYADRRAGGERYRRRSRSRSRSRGRSKRERSEERQQDRRRRGEAEEDDEDDEAFQARVAAALEAQQGEDEDRLIEERRRRRQEILTKHRQQQEQAASIAAPTAAALEQQPAPEEETAPRTEAATAPSPAAPLAATTEATAAAGHTNGSLDEVALSDAEEEEAAVAELGTEAGGALDIWRRDAEAASAADDAAAAAEGGPRAASAPASGIGEADDEELQRRLLASHPEAAAAAVAGAGSGPGPGGPAASDSGDLEDIFAATPEDAKRAEGAGPSGGAAAAPGAAAGRGTRGLVDSFDDAEGYYVFQVGEVVGGRYEVFATHGRGVFSSVLRARDLSAAPPEPGGPAPEVAIKVIRANETMYKAGQIERVILRKLAEADPQGRRHCIRMLGSFEYRNHLCLVFEPMDMNLRELTKRYGRGIGLSISAVRIYAQQMLVSLHHLRNCGVIHADIKPDNILVNQRRTAVKVCDFGSAMFSGDNEITPYLVSRFYRAPEIILGLPYDHPLDIWSVGCVVYELLTGRILFPGKTNNEMLKLMMDVKGAFPKKMIKKGEFAPRHFENDPNMSFAQLEEDPVTGRPVRRLIPNPTVRRDFAALLAGQSPDRKKQVQLADLLERMMALEPDRRITPKDALKHPFIRDPPPLGGA